MRIFIVYCGVFLCLWFECGYFDKPSFCGNCNGFFACPVSNSFRTVVASNIKNKNFFGSGSCNETANNPLRVFPRYLFVTPFLFQLTTRAILTPSLSPSPILPGLRPQPSVLLPLPQAPARLHFGLKSHVESSLFFIFFSRVLCLSPQRYALHPQFNSLRHYANDFEFVSHPSDRRLTLIPSKPTR